MNRIKELASVAEEFLLAVEEEMEHGCYETPDSVPMQYESEGDDYYANHDMIVDRVVSARNALKCLIDEIKEEDN